MFTSLFQRPPGIGLPDTPVMMHDLNLDEMMAPSYAAPLQSTGKLKVQIQFGDKALHVIIIEVRIIHKKKRSQKNFITDFSQGNGLSEIDLSKYFE